jgi:hypothetical protein
VVVSWLDRHFSPVNVLKTAGFEVLTASNTKMAVF